MIDLLVVPMGTAYRIVDVIAEPLTLNANLDHALIHSSCKMR
jgi:hypothetical protein